MDLLGAYASDSDEQDAKKCVLLLVLARLISQQSAPRPCR